MSTVLIQHTLVYNRKQPVDVFIRDGNVEKIEKGISEDADTIIDAEGNILIPGMIDMHVHLRVPGQEYKEDFVSGSAAAIAGGITTVGDMPNTNPPITTVALLQQNIARAQKEGTIDIVSYIGATTDNIEEIRQSVGSAVGVKVAPYFTAADGTKLIDDDEALEKLFALKLDMPIVVHCEDEHMVGKHAVKLKEYGGVDIHGKLRSPEVAISALKRIIAIVKKTNSSVHITHISTKKELVLIAKAKKEGVRITCDVTPHHLIFTDLDVAERGSVLKVNPPIRPSSDVSAMWEGVLSGDIDMIATDHAPHTWEEKNVESYWDVPSGLPELDTALLVLLNHVDDEQFTMERLVEITSTKPAEIFGLKGKGTIGPGSVADLVLVDLHSPTVIVRDQLKTKCGWSPWQGHMVRASITTVIKDGKIVSE